MKRIIFLATFFFGFFLIGYVMVGSLPGATISISKISKIQTVSIFPEGWAFFTKNPQDEDYIIYSFDKGNQNKYEKIINPTSSPKNFFGLNRISRLQSQEIGSAIHFIQDSSWVTIKGNINSNDSIIKKIKPTLIPIISKHPYFTGTYILQKIAPVPWAWIKDFKPNYAKSKIIIVEFKNPISKI